MKSMAAYPTIRRELDKACVLLQRSTPDVELEVIAREWSLTLRAVPDALFVPAMRRHRLLSNFLPTEADVLRLVRELEAEERAKTRRAALPEMLRPTPEMLETNVRQAARVLESLYPGSSAMKNEQAAAGNECPEAQRTGREPSPVSGTARNAALCSSPPSSPRVGLHSSERRNAALRSSPPPSPATEGPGSSSVRPVFSRLPGADGQGGLPGLRRSARDRA